MTSLQIDNLREQREIWREWLEWVRDTEQYHRDWTLGWDWGSRHGGTETDISEDA